ncbi:RagB/SusD family nutrient uptake outer membrane protein [Dyadobacter chenwenxiniae]|uniref:RagB/SusD family nutrient uptake outer membrane protein n=1 Tax=Dyadobacter chenwenxiniae TaxID=2906456 RepID=A0A9X1PPE8_9BACT|nr:RagB/SusD family nutrient uptake outer membrane protein [Dyadobacter chenwenxiniae]MCF0064628.1 RagB/SusD family nutrient uptake outer membrane protein [Dyadobacter chenwenxiniae]UON84316.1 RagB/SusD family nutrient uptake outer membrane protein [Dyadobacter chenwenxiniae]
MNILKINSRNIRVSLLFTTVLTLNSCDQKTLLNPIPETAITGENAFETPERILGLVNGIYKSAKSGNFYGGNYYTYSEARGEEFINRTSNTFTAFEAWNQTLNASSNFIAGFWASGYETINNANILIQGVADHPGVVSDVVGKQYIAEARFLRALSYYSLVTAYARPFNEDQGASKGLPLRLQAETTTANNDLARSTVAEVYAQIIKDLDEAEADLPLTHSSALLNTTRAHRNSAIALKTRVYLNSGKYDKVIDEAKKIVSAQPPFSAETGVKHKLENIVEIFTTNYTSSESILSVPMTELDNVTGQTSFPYVFNANSEYNLNPAGIWGDTEWRATDLRRTFSRTASGVQFLTKYSKPSPFLDYLPIIRYSEVLLNYAEAAARKGDLATAKKLLIAVRNRSDASYIFPNAAVASQPNLIKTILTERRIELLGEGFRSNDIVRNLEAFPAKSGNGLVAPAVGPAQANYVFPLPNTEIITNKLLLE